MQITFEGVHGNDTVYMDCLRSICGDTEGKSMADLCCNLAPHTPLLGYTQKVYVDVLPRILDHKEEQQFFVQMDVHEFIRDEKKYSSIICSDGIEHFSKIDGIMFLNRAETKCDKIILFTPLGAHIVEGGDNPEAHHSAWYPEETPGYASIVFSHYHPTLGVGAYFFWKCENIQQDFERVKNELKQKEWAKKLQVSVS